LKTELNLQAYVFAPLGFFGRAVAPVFLWVPGVLMVLRVLVIQDGGENFIVLDPGGGPHPE
jgi:hypothetical protein